VKASPAAEEGTQLDTMMVHETRTRSNIVAPCLIPALDYLARGWPSLALCPPDHVSVTHVSKDHIKKCQNPGKVPWHKWTLFQTTLPTEAEVREWFRRLPNSNVGMAFGVLIGVDVDKARGEELLQRLSGGDLPRTLSFTTKKGRRLLFTPPEGVELRTTPQPGGIALESGEVRLMGRGSQTVMPPSLHVDGHTYAWLPGCGPDDVEPAEAPAWMIRYMLPDAPRSAPHNGSPHANGDRIPEGQRNTHLASLAGTMRRRGMIRTAIEAALLEENAERCDPPLPDDEVRTIAASIAWYPPGGSTNGNGKPAAQARPKAPSAIRDLPPFAPFPVEALPGPLDQIVTEAATAIGCDASFVALPALAAIASAIGNSRTIRLKHGWVEPSVLWCGIVGDSGTLKTPAYSAIIAPIHRLQRELLQEHRQETTAHQAALETWKADRKAFKDGKGPDPGEQPTAPVYRRAVVSDITIEKLCEVLEDNPRGVLVARDELSGWLGSFTRYKGKQGGTDLPNWLEMSHAGPIQYDRKTGERRSVYVPRAAVSLTGGIQPGVLARALTPEHLDAGLAARMLLTMPPRRQKSWTEAELHPDTEAGFKLLFEKLRALEMHRIGDDLMPLPLALSLDAKKVWVRHYNHFARVQAAAEGEIAAALSKLEGAAARLTLVHYCTRQVMLGTRATDPILQSSMEAGIAMALWFTAEARRIYAMLSESPEERTSRRLVEFIRSRGGAITVRELQRANQVKYPTSAAAEAALESLVSAGLAHWEEHIRDITRGRPGSDRLILHPTADTNRQNSATGDDDEEPGEGVGT
jgi:hypothetical protein